MKIKNILLSTLIGATALTPMFATVSCNRTVALKSITVHGSELSIKPEGTTQMFVAPYPSNATNIDVTWSVDDTAKADITETGCLIAKTSECDVVVTAKSKQDETITNFTTVHITNSAVETEKLIDYIHDRTFSIAAYNTSSNGTVCFGTGWILSDATPTTYTDYEYWIATNWHVKHGMETVGFDKPETKILYGDGKSETGLSLDNPNDFREFDKNNNEFVYEDENKFLYDSQNGANSNRKAGIDLAVAKVKFSNPTTEMKTKLDKLNTLQQTKGYINQFAPATDDENHPLPFEMAIAGFPALTYKVGDKDVLKPTWRTQTIHPYGDDKMQYYAKNASIHTAGLPDDVMDAAPQYRMVVSKELSYLPEGSSGSMVLGKMDGEILVYGIYWGGFPNRLRTNYQPSCSIFNTAEKNFVENYIK